jgi:heme/copper-type cytochrome/quinol oxidase subunit 1
MSSQLAEIYNEEVRKLQNAIATLGTVMNIGVVHTVAKIIRNCMAKTITTGTKPSEYEAFMKCLDSAPPPFNDIAKNIVTSQLNSVAITIGQTPTNETLGRVLERISSNLSRYKPLITE